MYIHMATLTWKELCRDTALAVATRDSTAIWALLHNGSD